MKISRNGIVVLLTLLLSCLTWAEDRTAAATQGRAAATEKASDSYELAVKPTRKASGTSAGDTANYEVFEDIVIAAGKTVYMDSTLDYASTNSVAVTVLCIICSSAATSLANSGLVLQARWSNPEASYVTAESKAGTSFTYLDSGGAIFNVYGPQFRFALQNKGTQTIAIQQVTIFRRSQ